MRGRTKKQSASLQISAGRERRQADRTMAMVACIIYMRTWIPVCSWMVLVNVFPHGVSLFFSSSSSSLSNCRRPLQPAMCRHLSADPAAAKGGPLIWIAPPGTWLAGFLQASMQCGGRSSLLLQVSMVVSLRFNCPIHLASTNFQRLKRGAPCSYHSCLVNTTISI